MASLMERKDYAILYDTPTFADCKHNWIQKAIAFGGLGGAAPVLKAPPLGEGLGVGESSRC